LNESATALSHENAQQRRLKMLEEPRRLEDQTQTANSEKRAATMPAANQRDPQSVNLDDSLTDSLRRGCRALSQIGSTTVNPLRGWLQKENHLVAEVRKHSKGEPSRLSAEEYEAAVQAGRVGRVLARAEHASPIRVPQAYGDLGKHIERLATRLHGFGLGKAITTDSLREISPSQMRHLVDNARKLGLLDDGPAWATKTIAAKCIAHDLVQAVEKNRSLDRGALR
jgi:hypothetical protein